MKAVREIIWYLNGRGLLASDDLRYLRARGFIDFEEEADLARRQRRRRAPEAVPEPEYEPHEIEYALTPRVRHRRTFRRTRARMHPQAGAISMRLLRMLPAWEPELTSLVRYAAGAAHVRTLADGLAVIKGLPPASLDALTAAAIRRERPSLPELWRALAFEGYRADAIAGPDGRGPAAVALREILRGRCQGEMGCYSAALKYAGFAHLYALVQSQRAVLASIGRLMASDPFLFDRPLFDRHYEPGCYWALTIIASALVLYRPDWPVRTHDPARSFPDSEGLRDAVRAAAMLDVRLLARVLAEDVELPELRCPLSWDRGRFAPAQVSIKAA